MSGEILKGFFFHVRAAGAIEQIHCSATDIDVLSLS